MSNGMIWIGILMMALLTFTSRYAFFSSRIKLTMNPSFQRFMGFTAPAILTAIWVPIVFSPSLEVFEKNLNLNWQQLMTPELIAGLGTMMVSCLTRHTLVTVSLGMIMYALCRWIMS